MKRKINPQECTSEITDLWYNLAGVFSILGNIKVNYSQNGLDDQNCVEKEVRKNYPKWALCIGNRHWRIGGTHTYIMKGQEQINNYE